MNILQRKAEFFYSEKFASEFLTRKDGRPKEAIPLAQILWGNFI